MGQFAGLTEAHKETQVTKAETLLESLAGEQTRWRKRLAQIEALERSLDSLCLVGAFYLTCLLKMDERRRESRLASFVRRLLELDFGAELREYLNLPLASKAEVLKR